MAKIKNYWTGNNNLTKWRQIKVLSQRKNEETWKRNFIILWGPQVVIISDVIKKKIQSDVLC